jgi:hypothetical protein
MQIPHSTLQGQLYTSDHIAEVIGAPLKDWSHGSTYLVDQMSGPNKISCLSGSSDLSGSRHLVETWMLHDCGLVGHEPHHMSSLVSC